MAKRWPPSTYTKPIGRKLCDLVSEGTSLNAACQELALPRRRVRNWLVRYPAFGAEMAVAQQMHWDQMAEEVVDIVDRCDGSSQSEVTKARAASDRAQMGAVEGPARAARRQGAARRRP